MAYKKPDFEPTRDEMLRILEQHIKKNEKGELVHVIESVDRVAAQDVVALHSLPNAKFSKLDGIAVRFSYFEQGDSLPDTSSWRVGNEYVFSNTGCAIPEGYDTVIAIEKVSFDSAGRLEIIEGPPKRGNHVGEPGSSVRQDEIVLTKGTLITPALLGILVSAGIAVVPVLTRTKVIFIPTGDELVPFGKEVPVGKNIESNSAMITAYLKQWGAEPTAYPIVPDDPEQLRNALKKALSEADIVVICAGSSKGSKDFTMDVMEELGQVIVHELGHGPGKHCSFSTVDGKPVIGLPGPPMGADLTAVYYLQNAIRLMNMQPMVLPTRLKVKLVEDAKKFRIDFVAKLYIYRKNGQFYTKPISIGDMTRAESLQRCNADLYVAKHSQYKAGEEVEAELHCPVEYIKEGGYDYE